MSGIEPVGYDGHGAPIYGYQLGERLDDDTRRLLRERVERGEAYSRQEHNYTEKDPALR